jgi:ATP-dependent DNA helicase PIF1
VDAKSTLGKKLLRAKLIIWDECTMAPQLALAAVDRMLQDLTDVKKPFGGKVIVLGGDWRQSLPISLHSNKTVILGNCLKKSLLWPKFKHFSLETNMRTDPDETAFANWLLKLGNGTLKNNCGLDDDIIEISPECVVNTEPSVSSITQLIDEVFGKNLADLSPEDLSKRAILCPKNEESLLINEDMINRIPGEKKEYYSADSAVTEPGEENDMPLEFLNHLTPSGMPPHKLSLKEGAIIMLLRNMGPSRGLCNGTRLIIRKMHTHIIEAEILTGTSKGQIVFLPRIKMSPSDSSLPFSLERVQFPIRVSYCMTITKSQGQSFLYVGIYLPQPVFTHGQLYVAFSRAQRKNNVRVLISQTEKQGQLLKKTKRVFTKNVVFKEIFNM